METPTKGHRCVACHGEQRTTSSSRSWHRSHAERANCVVCHGFIPDLGVVIGSGNRDICQLCHSGHNASLRTIHERHTERADLSCLECHGGTRPPIDAYSGSAVGGSSRVCDLCHGNESGSAREIHEKHTDKNLDCGSCHIDANLQDDRAPMPPRDDSRRALTNRSGEQECFICHSSENASLFEIHWRHGRYKVWCYTCHEPDDGDPAGVSGPVGEPASSCYVCHYHRIYSDEQPFDIHNTHSGLLKCYVCHQTQPPLADWPREWLGGSTVSAVGDDLPGEHTIGATTLWAHPNPFNPRTTIVYEIARSSVVTVAVYDLRGRLVETLVRGEHRNSGSYTIPFEPQAASGIYFVRMQAGMEHQTAKIVLLK
jgi:hypothetical protein